MIPTEYTPMVAGVVDANLGLQRTGRRTSARYAQTTCGNHGVLLKVNGDFTQ
jgi:hypothetical protein